MKARKVILSLGMWGLAATSHANLITNPDFESGNIDGWTMVDQNDGCNSLQAVDYAAVPGFGGADSIPSLGGTYGAYLRPGGSLNTGISQTVDGVPSVELSYSVDFYVREVQLPGDSRTEQTIYLYLNGDLMDQLTVGAPTDDPGTASNFSGTYNNASSSVEFRIVSERSSCAFAWGQLIIDNVVLDCSNEQDCLALPTPVVTIAATNNAAEPSTDGEFTITSTEAAGDGGLTVNYSIDGSSTATSNSDYSALSGTVVIPPGEIQATISVQVTDDSEIEGVETVTVNLVDEAAYDLGNPSSATVNITSDDVAPPPAADNFVPVPTLSPFGLVAMIFGFIGLGLLVFKGLVIRS